MDYYYRLEKLDIDEGETSNVPLAHSIQGELAIVPKDSVTSISPLTLDDVSEGFKVIVTRGLKEWLRTSPISEILERGEDYVKFKTTNSTYLLTRKEAK